MISTHNIPSNKNLNNKDFTYKHYRELLLLAKLGRQIFCYSNIDWDQKFILWRHDVDISLNSSLRLAKIEKEAGVKATYFVNPHSEFYNLTELNQHQIIKEILSLGHDIGLHLDVAFYNISSEADLDKIVANEARYIEDLFDAKPSAFSFHNPIAEHLEFDSDKYGGLKNCYSKRFKEEVSYCSDSNGYWRFRRLHDVLKDGKEDRLQILTHPGWWQEHPYPPRQRIFRAAYGRAGATMKMYDRGLVQYQRVNFSGESKVLNIFREKRHDDFELCDYLWNKSNFKTLFLKLWRIHETQTKNLCILFLIIVKSASPCEVKKLIESGKIVTDGNLFFKALFQNEWENALKELAIDYDFWKKNRNLLVIEESPLSNSEFEKGCVFLCSIIKKVAEWGLKQKFKYDGFDIQHLDSFSTDITKPEAALKKTIEKCIHDFVEDWSSFRERLKSITVLNSSD